MIVDVIPITVGAISTKSAAIQVVIAITFIARMRNMDKTTMTIFAEMGDLETLATAYKLAPGLRHVPIITKYRAIYRGVQFVADDLEDMRELAVLLGAVSTAPKDGSALGQAWHIPSFLETALT